MHPTWQALLHEQDLSVSGTHTGSFCLADIGKEAATALAAPVLCPLPQLGLLRAEGEDATSFLQNLSTNDLRRLAVGSSQWNSLNSPKGRMLANFLVSRDETGYGLLLSADLAAATQKKLSMYVLRAKLKVTDASATHLVMGLGGQGARALLEKAGFTPPGAAFEAKTVNGIQLIAYPAGPGGERFLLIVPAESLAEHWQALCHAGAKPIGNAWWQREDILAGLPWLTTATQDEFVAQMINYELIGGVSFQKGCYLGQEIIARTQHLGRLKKRMYLARVEGPASPGQDLYSAEFGEQSCGKLVNVAPSFEGGSELLAVLQMSAFEAGEVRLGAPDGPQLAFGEQPYPVD